MADNNSDACRKTEFKRNNALESLLKDINSNLWLAESQIMPEHSQPQFPMLIIVGPLRSGTTLFMQWLASLGPFSYPTNILSRFYGAPIIGAKIQLLLTDPRFNFRNELGEFLQTVEFSSENGKTKGALAPNEFWYFWRRFLPDPKRDVWTDDELRAGFDSTTMLAELAGMMDVFEKPFAAKGMLFNYNIPYFNEIFEKIIFVQIKRDPTMNVQSVLSARERQLGSRDLWYSFDIPEYERLKDLDPVSQAAGQVACINRAVDTGLSTVDDQRKITLSYEDFCENPQKTFEELISKLKLQGYMVDAKYSGDDRFTPTNKLLLSSAEADLAMQIYQQYISGKS